MFASSSPFDEALARPFLDEPVQKKWSVRSLLWKSSSQPDCPSDCSSLTHDDEDYYGTSPEEMESIELRSLHDVELGDVENQEPEEETIDFEETRGLLSKEVLLQDPKTAEDMDLAVLRERKEEIGEITSSMRHINDIQREIAIIVDSQDCDIKRMSWNAIQAFEQAKDGLQELDRAAGLSSGWGGLGGRRFSALLVGTMVFVMGVYWASGGSGMDSHGGDEATVSSEGDLTPFKVLQLTVMNPPQDP